MAETLTQQLTDHADAVAADMVFDAGITEDLLRQAASRIEALTEERDEAVLAKLKSYGEIRRLTRVLGDESMARSAAEARLLELSPSPLEMASVASPNASADAPSADSEGP